MSYKNKRVLVTGAAGTIGSELCRQLSSDLSLQHRGDVIAFDNSEIALYNLERELGSKVGYVLGDVSDVTDVTSVFADYCIDAVFHAAAYKHVSICERNPAAARRVNSYDTQLMVNAAKDNRVPTFVLVSTDKAVRPTCVMGKTKAEAEEITRRFGYTVVRLGNVIDSSGSVLPLWRQQITEGRPVTITDGRATRYFINLTTAGHWILSVGMMPPGTYVPEMGEPVSIFEMAQSLGATKFKFIGLAPGEKVHEELYAGVRQPTDLYLTNEDVAVV